jgi:hypothetical protein
MLSRVARVVAAVKSAAKLASVAAVVRPAAVHPAAPVAGLARRRSLQPGLVARPRVVSGREGLPQEPFFILP